MVGERPEQTGTIAGGYAVRAVAEFGEQVQHSLRGRPAEGKVAGDFCTGVVGNEQSARTRWIWWWYASPRACSSAPTKSSKRAGNFRSRCGRNFHFRKSSKSYALLPIRPY